VPVRVYCNGYVTAVAAGQSQRFYSGVGIFNWYYLSSPPQILRGSRCPLDLGGLIYIVLCCMLCYIHDTYSAAVPSKGVIRTSKNTEILPPPASLFFREKVRKMDEESTSAISEQCGGGRGGYRVLWCTVGWKTNGAEATISTSH
jgi:hypothetical protein